MITDWWMWGVLVVGFGLTIFFSIINALNYRDRVRDTR